MIICDFDGVVTNNLVLTDENGKETVSASRSDSMHIKSFARKRRGCDDPIFGTESGREGMRAKKMGVEAIHGIGMLDEKGEVMRRSPRAEKGSIEDVIYVGNDLNDLPCFEVAGWSVAVADAYPEVLRAADHVLMKNGGHGAIRELCELVLKQLPQKEN